MTINQSINQSVNQIYFSPHIFLGAIKQLFNRKLHVHVKFAGYEKDSNTCAKN